MSETDKYSTGVCQVAGCGRRRHGAKYCQSHHVMHREGKPLREIKNNRAPGAPKPQCSYVSCSRSAKARGLCDAHYTQWKKGAELSPLGSTYSSAHKGPRAARATRPVTQRVSYQCFLPECSVVALKRGILCRKHHHTALRYSLGDLQYARLVASGVCDMCGTRATPLHIDHDHSCCNRSGSCGKCVRGALCQRCNLMLGQAGDDGSLLLAAIAYLGKPNDRASVALTNKRDAEDRIATIGILRSRPSLYLTGNAA